MFQVKLTSYGQSLVSSNVTLEGILLVEEYISDSNLANLSSLTGLTIDLNTECAGNTKGTIGNIRVQDLSSVAYSVCTILFYKTVNNETKLVCGYSQETPILIKSQSQLDLFISLDFSVFTHGFLCSTILSGYSVASSNSDGLLHLDNPNIVSDNNYSVYSKQQVDDLLSEITPESLGYLSLKGISVNIGQPNEVGVVYQPTSTKNVPHYIQTPDYATRNSQLESNGWTLTSTWETTDGTYIEDNIVYYRGDYQSGTQTKYYKSQSNSEYYSIDQIDQGIIDSGHSSDTFASNNNNTFTLDSGDSDFDPTSMEANLRTYTYVPTTGNVYAHFVLSWQGSGSGTLNVSEWMYVALYDSSTTVDETNWIFDANMGFVYSMDPEVNGGNLYSFTYGSPYTVDEYTFSQYDIVYGFWYYTSTWNSLTNLPYGGSESGWFRVINEDVYSASGGTDVEYSIGSPAWSYYGMNEMGEDIYCNYNNSSDFQYYNDSTYFYGSDPGACEYTWDSMPHPGEGGAVFVERHEYYVFCDDLHWYAFFNQGENSSWNSYSFMGLPYAVSSGYARDYESSSSPQSSTYALAQFFNTYGNKSSVSQKLNYAISGLGLPSNGTKTFTDSYPVSGGSNEFRMQYTYSSYIARDKYDEYSLDASPLDSLYDTSVRNTDSSSYVYSAVKVNGSWLINRKTEPGRILLGVTGNTDVAVVSYNGMVLKGNFLPNDSNTSNVNNIGADQQRWNNIYTDHIYANHYHGIDFTTDRLTYNGDIKVQATNNGTEITGDVILNGDLIPYGQGENSIGSNTNSLASLYSDYVYSTNIETGVLNCSSSLKFADNAYLQWYAGGNNIDVHSDLAPYSNNTYSLGNSSYKWKDIYVGTIHADNYDGLPSGSVSTTDRLIYNGSVKVRAYSNEVTVDCNLTPSAGGTNYSLGTASYSWSKAYIDVIGDSYNTSNMYANTIYFSSGVAGDAPASLTKMQSTIGIQCDGGIFPQYSSSYSLGSNVLKWSEIHVGTVYADTYMNLPNISSTTDRLTYNNSAKLIAYSTSIVANEHILPPDNTGQINIGSSSARWGSIYANAIDFASGNSIGYDSNYDCISVTGNLVPSSSSGTSYMLGSSNEKWSALYVDDIYATNYHGLPSGQVTFTDRLVYNNNTKVLAGSTDITIYGNLIPNSSSCNLGETQLPWDTAYIDKVGTSQYPVTTAYIESLVIPYGECNSAITSSCTVTVSPAPSSLYEGTLILVKFVNSYGGKTTGVTLKVNNFSAYPLYMRGSVGLDDYINHWEAGEIWLLRYHSNTWVVVSRGVTKSIGCISGQSSTSCIVQCTTENKASITPSTNMCADLGSSSYKFDNLYVNNISCASGIQAQSISVTGSISTQSLQADSLNVSSLSGNTAVCIANLITGLGVCSIRLLFVYMGFNSTLQPIGSALGAKTVIDGNMPLVGFGSGASTKYIGVGYDSVENAPKYTLSGSWTSLNSFGGVSDQSWFLVVAVRLL